MKTLNEILNESFPECTDEQRRKLFSVIQALLIMKVMELTNNKSYVSYRDNGRFLKEFRFLCEFIKSEIVRFFHSLLYFDIGR